ncbi:MAG: TRCF domain-containing protein, partial [Dehalococcoidia bacterium]
LAEAVEELKVQQTREAIQGATASEAPPTQPWRAGKQSPSITLPLVAHIPEEYVPNLSTRLSLYHRLARIEQIEEVEDMAREFRDRFGALPQPAENLLRVVKIKVLAMRAGVSSISTQGRQIVIKPQTDSRRLTAISSVGAAVKIGATQIKLDTRLPGHRWPEVLEEILMSNCA